MFNEISGVTDFENVLIDGTIVQAHRKASGAKGGTQDQAIGSSRGGLTTKTVALVDALGDLANFVILPGQAHDMKGVELFIKNVSLEALLADNAFDADWLLIEIYGRGACGVVPPKANRKVKRDYDKHPINGAPDREFLRKDKGVQDHSHQI